MTARTPTVGARLARPTSPPSQLEGNARAPRRRHDADRLTLTSAQGITASFIVSTRRSVLENRRRWPSCEGTT